MRRCLLLAWTLSAGVTLAAQAPPVRPTSSVIDASDLQRVRGMLRDARDVVKMYYYDRTFRGVDLDASYKKYEAQLVTAPSLNVGMTIVAAFLEELHDSHVFLTPPPRPYRLEYGYRMRPVGDTIFVTAVRPGSDAEGKLTPGDQVLLVNNGRTSRSSFTTMSYLLTVLQPQLATQLLVRDAVGRERTVLVQTQVTDLPRRPVRDGSAVSVNLEDLLRQERDETLTSNHVIERGDVLIWKMPSFLGTPGDIDRVFAKAKGHSALILDLRGNPGGFVDNIDKVISHLFTKTVKVGDRVGRDRRSQVRVDGRRDAFAGRLVVLIDAASLSSAEILARVVQLEGRGTVIGDRSAGAVMEARMVPMDQSTGNRNQTVIYAFSVTVGDLVMADGASLEGIGVTPDELLLPTAQDLALGRDTVMSRAAKLVGLDLDPVAAAKLFPFEWK